jgi:hypothetical protein
VVYEEQSPDFNLIDVKLITFCDKIILSMTFDVWEIKMGVFFDVVVSVQFSDGVARLNVAEVASVSQDGQRVLGAPTQIATSLPGLLQMQGQINQLIDGLIERKVLRKQDPAATGGDVVSAGT